MKNVGPVEYAYRHVFETQRKNAIKRGINFTITYEDWVAWWRKELGPQWFRRRGRNRGQYVMSRKADKGDYSIGNIECLQCQDNQSNIRLHKPPDWCRNNKITKEAAFDIKYSGQSAGVLTKRYSITEATVRDIRKGRSWKHL